MMDFQALPPIDLTAAILERTSGAPCARLRAEACAYVDGELPPDRSSLVRAHLEHCPACRSLVETLKATEVMLPDFSNFDPGPWFAQGIKVQLRAQEVAQETSGWRRFLRRPRACLELAYAGTLVGALTIQVPAWEQPFQSIRIQALPSLQKVEAQTGLGTQKLQQGLGHVKTLHAKSLRLARREKLRLKQATTSLAKRWGLDSKSTEPSKPPSRSTFQD